MSLVADHVESEESLSLSTVDAGVVR
jgi:hypothetical protein